MNLQVSDTLETLIYFQMTKLCNIKMKKVFSVFISLYMFFYTLPVLAFDFGLEDTGKGAGYDLTDINISLKIGIVLKMLLSLIGVLLLGLLVYGGYRWMIARDNDQMVTKAKDTIKHAIVGLVIIVAAYIITAFIGTKIGF